jgi:hypothetical protein
MANGRFFASVLTLRGILNYVIHPLFHHRQDTLVQTRYIEPSGFMEEKLPEITLSKASDEALSFSMIAIPLNKYVLLYSLKPREDSLKPACNPGNLKSGPPSH